MEGDVSFWQVLDGLVPLASHDHHVALPRLPERPPYGLLPVELDARPGGEGVFRWDDGEVRVAHVEEVVPGERLGFRWSDGDGAESTVTIDLEDIDGGTRLRVVETPSAVAGEWATGLEVNALFAAAAAVR